LLDQVFCAGASFDGPQGRMQLMHSDLFFVKSLIWYVKNKKKVTKSKNTIGTIFNRDYEL